MIVNIHLCNDSKSFVGLMEYVVSRSKVRNSEHV